MRISDWSSDVCSSDLHGIRNWKLQAGNLAFCFVAMALLGVAAQAATAPFLPATLALGFLFLGILPSTVQSATAASSLAGGNVAASRSDERLVGTECVSTFRSRWSPFL